MNDHHDPHEPGLDALDATARAASRGLRAHVDRQLDAEQMLAALPATAAPRSHRRLLAAAAVAALFIGTVAVLGDGPGGDDRSRLEVDEDGNQLPPPEPGVLTPQGPGDGRDSQQLPVTAEPNVDLSEGDTITVSGRGFAPGERVGIVQCTSEAGEGNGGAREERLGIDACTTSTVKYADADDDGVATGTFAVTRLVTTPASGTVDCATEALRCIVAMGALDDYDRSGGYGLTFTGGGEPIDLPTLSVSPADGLADGDVVHVEGAGFVPGPVSLTICSLDPAGCWSTGEPYELDEDEVQELGLVDELGGPYQGVGLLADATGRVSGDVPLWRFLPGAAPSTYIDCAVSRCSLRVFSDFGGHAPPPPTLGFTPGGPGPTPPAIAVDPTQDLQPGDEVVVRGQGFAPGTYYAISLCASPIGAPEDVISCFASEMGEDQIDDDGTFAREWEIPEVRGTDESFEGATTTMCAAGADCGGTETVDTDELCDGVTTECTIRIDVAFYDASGYGPPSFPPVPVPVSFRP